MVPSGLLDQGPETAGAFLARAEQAGIDHICCGDHVSFFGGLGFDGLVQATALAMLHPTLPVYTGVYLLPLRHPVLVARQLADIARLAPGRLIFGVGIGGEDRHEVSSCGVDPATRGRRLQWCGARSTSSRPRAKPALPNPSRRGADPSSRGGLTTHSPPLRGGGVSGYLRPDLCRSRLIARAALSPCRANSDMAP